MERLKTNLKTDNKPRKYSYNSNGELPMHINLFLQKNKSSELKKPSNNTITNNFITVLTQLT